MSLVRTSILSYVDHIDDQDYLFDIVTKSDFNTLVESLTSLLQDKDEDIVGRACLFFRDLILFSSKSKVETDFVEKLKSSAVVPQLERLLDSENWFIRNHAIFALGKIISTASVPKLHRAFKDLRDRDPLSLPALMFEILWIEKNSGLRRSWSLIDKCIDSPKFATRWATLGFIPFEESDRTSRETQDNWFAALRCDNHPLVKEEAEYKYQMYSLQRSHLTGPERRKQTRTLREQEPAITFAVLSRSFLNQMSKKHVYSYSLPDLEQYIIEYQKTPSLTSN
ncbi:MAG: HEAT repeat domain-containing protein [Candidatus Obscuribacterales bacterium]|nr:HEAT repeat domain-containing protein [Candidatus Obscuribacterales bacterium]